MPKRQRTGQCAYCGATGPVTSDHVPPKSLFPPGSRVNLITVDACPSCHDGFKLDDEYFRVALGIRDDLPENDNSKFLRDRTRRTLASPGSQGLRRSLARSTVLTEVRTQSGIVLGKRVALRIAGVRIERTAVRIVKALFFKEFSRVVPSSHKVDVSLFDLQLDDTALLHPDVQDVLRVLHTNNSHKKVGSVFEYWFSATDSDQDSSVWLFQLHDTFGFIGWTMPRDS